MTENEITKAKEVSSESVAESAADGISAEVASQLAERVQVGRAADSAPMSGIENSLKKINWGLSDKEKAEAIKNAGTGLEGMVMGDLPALRERMAALGLDTTQLDAKAKELQKTVDAAKPVQEAILKGDMAALQKLVKDSKPEELAKTIELIQKHFEKAGIPLEIEFTNGNLIISGTNSDRAILINKDKTDVIGVNPDGSYDFNRQYRRENPASELSSQTTNALADWMMPKHRYIPRHWDHPPIDRIQPFPSPRHQLEQLQNNTLK